MSEQLWVPSWGLLSWWLERIMRIRGEVPLIYSQLPASTVLPSLSVNTGL